MTETKTGNPAQAGGSCKTIVITGAHAPPDHHQDMGRLALERTGDPHYDLLTVPEPDSLTVDGPLLDQVAADVALAARLHRAERVLVAAPSADAIRRRLARHPALASSGLAFDVEALNLAAPEETLVLVCMDYRQHVHGLRGLVLEAFSGAFGHFSAFAMAGGAKDIVRGTDRGKIVLEELKSLHARQPIQRIVLTMHTDCGALGGSSAPCFRDARGRPNAQLQHGTLEGLLRRSLEDVRSELPEALIHAAIVGIDEAAGRVDGVRRITFG